MYRFVSGWGNRWPSGKSNCAKKEAHRQRGVKHSSFFNRSPDHVIDVLLLFFLQRCRFSIPQCTCRFGAWLPLFFFCFLQYNMGTVSYNFWFLVCCHFISNFKRGLIFFHPQANRVPFKKKICPMAKRRRSLKGWEFAFGVIVFTRNVGEIERFCPANSVRS